LVRLKECIGREIGWAEIRPTWDVEFAAMRFESAGYPHRHNPRLLTVDRGCRAGLRSEQRPYPASGRLHYCSSTPGDSGGPIFELDPGGVLRIAMVMTGQIKPMPGLIDVESEDHANYGIDLKSVSAWLEDAIRKDLEASGMAQADNPAAR
jgi:hypothetical protein